MFRPRGVHRAKSLRVASSAGLPRGRHRQLGPRGRFAHLLKHDLFEEDFTHCYELSDPIAVEWMDFVADFVLEDI